MKKIVDEFINQYESIYSKDQLKEVIGSYYKFIHESLIDDDLDVIRLKYLGMFKIFKPRLNKAIRRLNRIIKEIGPREEELKRLEILKEYERKNLKKVRRNTIHSNK